MLLAGSALGASPPQNLCSLAGAMVIRHGPYPPHPLCGNQKSVKAPSPNACSWKVSIGICWRLSCVKLVSRNGG